MAATAIDSFDRLYRRYARDVYRFALGIVRNPTEAEDVTQTAFLNAFRAYTRGVRPERPHSWLIAIAHNAIRSGRRRSLRRPREVALEAAAAQLAVAPAERSEVGAVLRALGELPVNQREALAMRELEGRSYTEIAATLGVSTTAVESLVARARRTLRRQCAALRGLLLLPFRHADETAGGVAAKAAAVVAAAGLVAGGMDVGTNVARPAHPNLAPRASEPRGSLSSQAAVEGAAVAVVHRTARPERHPVRPAPPAHESAAPPPALPPQQQPPAGRATPEPAAAAAARTGTAPPAVAVGPHAPAVTATAAVALPAVAASATAATPAVETPAVTVATPVATATVPSATVPAVTVPAVTVPAVTVPAVTVPAVTVPAVTVPAVSVPSVTVTPPRQPSVPQVSGLPGIH